MKTEISVLIRKARKAKKISQGELAAALGHATPQSVSNIERGVAPFPTKHLMKVAKVLGVPPVVLKIALVGDYIFELNRI